MSTKIVVDTSVWIEFFRNKNSPVSDRLIQLLRSNRVVLTGMVFAEILQGIKSPKEAKLVENNLQALSFAETDKSIWKHAGDTSSNLRKKGITIPLSDIIIASVAISGGYEIYTLDPHFNKIPGLKFNKTTDS